MKAPAVSNVLGIAVIVGALAMRLASTEAANWSFMVLAAYALLGRIPAIQAIALTWLFGSLSEGVAPPAGAATVARYGVMFVASLSVLFRLGQLVQSLPAKRCLLSTLLLGCFLLMHSLAFSANPEISALKTIWWLCALTTLLLAWGGTSRADHNKTEVHVFHSLVAMVAVSAPLVLFEPGYLVNGRGFQGILSHPQIFGCAAACAAAWLAGRLLAGVDSWKRHLGFLGLCVGLVIASEARTAGFALAGGLLVSVMMSAARARGSVTRVMPGLASPIGRFGLVAASVALASTQLESVSRFVLKWDETVSFLESVDASRGEVVRTMLANIRDDYVLGIGLGVPSDGVTTIIERDALFDLPVAAPVEKSVTPLAVLEELGVTGFALFMVWALVLGLHAARAGICALTVATTIFVMNLGEATLFSPGGFGLLQLTLLGWAVTSRTEEVHGVEGARHLVLARRP